MTRQYWIVVVCVVVAFAGVGVVSCKGPANDKDVPLYEEFSDDSGEVRSRGSQNAVVLWPVISMSGVYTQSFETITTPIYLTSVLMAYTGSYQASAGESLTVTLSRTGEAPYELLTVAPTNDFNTLSWNVEAMHGQLYLRRGDNLVYTLSDTNVASLRPCGRSD